MDVSLYNSRLFLRLLWVCNVALLGCVGYVVWDCATFKPPEFTATWSPPQNDTRIQHSTLEPLRNYLSAVKVLAPEKKKAPAVSTPVAQPQPVKTTASAERVLILKGTLVDPDLPVAFVETKKTRKQKAVYVGDTVEGFVVRSIEAGLIRLSYGGKEVRPLHVAKVKTPIVAASSRRDTSRLPGPEPVRKVAKEDIKKLLKEPTSLLRDVGFTPKVNAAGAIEGMKIIRINSKSIFAKRGIRVGDVIVNINGKATTGIGAAMALLGDLDKAKKFTIKLKRYGRLKTFIFDVE